MDKEAIAGAVAVGGAALAVGAIVGLGVALASRK